MASADIIAFEGESGITPPGVGNYSDVGYRVLSDPAALGGQYIDTDHRDAKQVTELFPEGYYGDFAVFREYSVTIPAGTYDLWGRIYCPVGHAYNSERSDDPDSNDGAAAFENDSFYLPATFGGDPMVDLDRVNGMGSSGRFDGDGVPPNPVNVKDEYQWINLTAAVDINGTPAGGSGIDPAPAYTTAGGAESLMIMSREGGIRHDAWALVPSGYQPTEQELVDAIPEPSSLVLLLVALGGIALLRRR